MRLLMPWTGKRQLSVYRMIIGAVTKSNAYAFFGKELGKLQSHVSRILLTLP